MTFSLAITEGSRKDFRDITKTLPHKTEISTPGKPKRFITIGKFQSRPWPNQHSKTKDIPEKGRRQSE